MKKKLYHVILREAKNLYAAEGILRFPQNDRRREGILRFPQNDRLDGLLVWEVNAYASVSYMFAASPSSDPCMAGAAREAKARASSQ